jgi:hypothetical protein
VIYRAGVEARATQAAIRDLMIHTATVAGNRNSLRRGTQVRLAGVSAVSRPDA